MKRVGLLRGVAEVESEDDPVARTGSAARPARANPQIGARPAGGAGALLPSFSRNWPVTVSSRRLGRTDRGPAGRSPRFFDRNVSALTLLGLDPAHPSHSCRIYRPTGVSILRNPDTEEYVPVRVKIPTMLPSWPDLPQGRCCARRAPLPALGGSDPA